MVARARGFTLLEILVAAIIVLMVAAFGLRSLVGGQSSVQSRGLAEELAEELRAARALAVAQQAPVGIVFPSNGGTTGISRSFYQLEGPSAPLATREIDYTSSYPRASIFVGIWGSGSINQPEAGTNDSDFQLDHWTLQQPTDYHLIFTPSGSVISNGMAAFGDGYFDILVSNGVTESGGTTSQSLTLRTPSAADKPYTVRVSPTGSVGVGPGAWGGPLATGAIPTGVVAKTAPNTSSSNSAPSIEAVLSEPQTNQDTDAGAIAVCGKERYLNIVVHASDPEGDQLMMSLQAANNSNPGGDTGAFSSNFPTAMRFDHELELWVGSWSWIPPLGSSTGDTFTITATVQDQTLSSPPENLGARLNGVEFEPVNKLACVNKRGPAANATHEVVWLNSEGTNVFSLTFARENRERSRPAWSPNGHKLCFYTMKKLVPPGKWEAQLHSVNEDGADLRQMFKVIGSFNEFALGPSFSPTSDHVTCTAFDSVATNTSSVYVARTYEDTPAVQKSFPAPPVTHIQARWHPENDWILFAEHDTSSGLKSIRYLNPWDTSEPHHVLHTEVGVKLQDANWSAQGDAVCFVRRRNIDIMDVDITTHADLSATRTPLLPPNTYRPEIPRFSPEKNYIAFVNRPDNDLYVVPLNASGDPVSPGAPPIRLTTGADAVYYSWNANSDEIVYNTGGEQLYVVKVLPPPSSVPKNITPKDFRASTTPAWWAP